ncbi:MAG: hypothetical protein U0892_20765 [Pirellulales bacterium]
MVASVAIATLAQPAHAAGAYPATPFGAPPAGTWQPLTAAGAPGFITSGAC